jgi:hypothetical protein
VVAGVRVKVSDATIISALNTPGGLVFDWRNETENDLLVRCVADSPVNDVLNQLHREGTAPPPGEFQRSWVTRRQGNGHRVGFQIENFADHAIYVEEGRSGSTKVQVFSWTGWHGDIRAVGFPWRSGTRPREGQHVLRNAANAVLAAQTGGSYTPLV